jgi:hypothetical protein
MMCARDPRQDTRHGQVRGHPPCSPAIGPVRADVVSRKHGRGQNQEPERQEQQTYQHAIDRRIAVGLHPLRFGPRADHVEKHRFAPIGGRFDPQGDIGQRGMRPGPRGSSIREIWW